MAALIFIEHWEERKTVVEDVFAAARFASFLFELDIEVFEGQKDSIKIGMNVPLGISNHL